VVCLGGFGGGLGLTLELGRPGELQLRPQLQPWQWRLQVHWLQVWL
jgi:hypothetical protein